MRIQKTMGIALLSFALLAVLAACGGPLGQSCEQQGTCLPATETVTIPPNPIDAVITLNDYKIVSSVTSFKVGAPYTFYVRNFGKHHHQFMIILTSLDVSKMSQDQIKQSAVIYIADLAPNGTQSIDYVFPASASGASYEMASHLHSDYDKGMKLAITVK